MCTFQTWQEKIGITGPKIVSVLKNVEKTNQDGQSLIAVVSFFGDHSSLREICGSFMLVSLHSIMTSYPLDDACVNSSKLASIS